MSLVSNMGLISVFLLILLAGFLLINKSENKAANTLFAFFLLVTSFKMSALFFREWYDTYGQLNLIRAASTLLQVPFFYLYIRKACFLDFKLSSKQLLHAVPFLIFAILFLVNGVSDEVDMAFAICSQLQFYLYIAMVFYEIHKYHNIHNQNHSLKDKAYKWLMTTSILFTIANTLILLRGIFQLFNDYQSLPILNIVISLFGLFVISWFVLKTMLNPELFSSVYQSSLIKSTSEFEEENNQHETERLLNFMKEKKPYLEESLTLQSLSSQTYISERQLSHIINRSLDQHFFDFINSYRVEEAKVLLKNKDLNIQQIMFRVGFNSKSSFNVAFKKHTSITPSAYRKSLT